MRESTFQAALIKQIKSLYPGCVVLKNDANYIQGFPDLLILYNDRWAALECKGSRTSTKQPNQEYYVSMLDEMSFAAFICPENKEAVLSELQRSFRPIGNARLSRR